MFAVEFYAKSSVHCKIIKLIAGQLLPIRRDWMPLGHTWKMNVFANFHMFGSMFVD